MADAVGANTLATLNGHFKEVYAEKLENLSSQETHLRKLIPFVEKSKESGGAYNQPVVLQQEHGATFSLGNSGAFALNDPSSAVSKNASLNPTQIVLRGSLSYEAIHRALKGRNAFIDSVDHIVTNIKDSMDRKLEIELMYGSKELGLVNANTTASTSFVVKLAEWAPGIWAGSEGMPIDIYSSDLATKRNGADITVTAVDMDTRTITVSAAQTLTADDRILFRGAKDQEMLGLDGIMTASGTLFGISTASYSMWKPSSFAAAGALSFAKLQKALARGVEKGMMGKSVCLVNPKGWVDLLNDESSLRRYDSSHSNKQVEKGSEKIVFHSQNGMLEIYSSNFVKEGKAYIIQPQNFKRIGAVDVTFENLGVKGEYFFPLANHAGAEIRCYSDQALFCKAPSRGIVVTGIVNS